MTGPLGIFELLLSESKYINNLTPKHVSPMQSFQFTHHIFTDDFLQT